MTKICSICKIIKTKGDFHKGRRSYCKNCENVYNKKRRNEKRNSDPEWYNKELERRRKWYKDNKWCIKANNLKWNYNLTLEEYNTLNENQNGICAICENKCSTGRSLAVDHNHKTNKIRGLLCSNCNSGLGSFKESIKFLDKAIEYLHKYEGV